MTIKQTARFRILSSIIQSSLGKSSEAKYSTHFLKMTIPVEGQIKLSYQSIVNFGHQNVYLELRNRYREEAVNIMKQHLERVAKEYAEAVENKNKLLEPKIEPYEAAPPKKIKLKLIDSSIGESLETVSKSVYNPSSTNFYRVTAIATIE